MINILITGGAGHVGASLANKLSEKDNVSIVILDNLSTGKKQNLLLRENIKFIEGDINKISGMEAMLKEQPFNYIFHYSAVVGVQRTQDHPLLVFDDIDGIKNILSIALQHSTQRVYFSSSSEVYGEPVEIPQHEMTTPLNSKIPYAIVKNVGESFLRSYQKEFNLNYTILRFFNTYGPLQSDDFVITRFIKLALENEDLIIYGDGAQTRTFLHVDDNINFTIECLENNYFNNDVVNLGSDEEMRIDALAEKVIEMTNSKSKIKFIAPLEEGDMSRRKPDLNKFRSVYQGRLVSIDEGIRYLIDRFKVS